MAAPSRRMPPKLTPGDRVAILSPSWAGPGFAPAVHEQAMRRFVELLELEPVEYPTTRQLGASAEARADDLNAAFADPGIRAIIATIGGADQITVVPHLDSRLALADPKPFVGYSDNTHILNWLWRLGIAGFYGGSTQVHFGPGPGVDPEHLTTLRAALFDGGTMVLPSPATSEDMGPDWLTPAALTDFGRRDRVEDWIWAGEERLVEGPSWGGCLDVMPELGLADRIPSLSSLESAVVLFETSEELPSTTAVHRWVRGLGERGVLRVAAGVLVARPPVESHEWTLAPADRVRARREQAEVIIETVQRYNRRIPICVGPSFGHTRPQVIVPYGGRIRIDPILQQVSASY